MPNAEIFAYDLESNCLQYLGGSTDEHGEIWVSDRGGVCKVLSVSIHAPGYATWQRRLKVCKGVFVRATLEPASRGPTPQEACPLVVYRFMQARLDKDEAAMAALCIDPRDARAVRVKRGTRTSWHISIDHYLRRPARGTRPRR